MFKDKEEELRRLEAELLREEEQEAWDEEPEDWTEDDDWEEEEEEEEEEDWEAAPAPRIPDWRIYNADRLDEDLEEFSEQVYDPGRRARGRWVAAGALILLAGVLLALAFLAARFGG